MALSYACEDPRYIPFFAERAAEGKYVILDNSAVEKGEPEELTSYVSKAMQMTASEIVAPDYFQDGQRTAHAVSQTFDIVHRFGYKGGVMVVPQGLTDREWINWIKDMAQFYPIATVGISRRYTDLLFGGHRLTAVAWARQALDEVGRYEVAIHLLGCWDRPFRDIGPVLKLPYVRGIDGSLPSVFTKYRLVLSPSALRPGPVIDILHDRYDPELLEMNIRRFGSLCWGLTE